MERTGTKGSRIYLYDNVKFVLICMVVMGHMVPLMPTASAAVMSVFNFIYSFHMPAFIFISGVFFKSERIAQKVVSYMCVGFLLKAVFFAGNLLLAEDAVVEMFGGTAIPWFMFVLAMYSVCTYLLRDIDRRVRLGLFLLMGCLALYDGSVGNYLYLSRAITFYPFFLLGEMCGSGRLVRWTRNKGARLAGAGILAAWMAACFWAEGLVAALSPFFFGTPVIDHVPDLVPFGVFYRLCSYVLSLALTLALISVMPDRPLPLITRYGSRTLQVYFWHQSAAKVVSALGAAAYLSARPFGGAVWLLLGCVLTVVLSTRPFSIPTEYVCRLVNARRDGGEKA